MQIERITSKGQLVPLTFHQNAVAASQTNAQLPLVETSATTSSTDNTGYVVPFPGEIVAVSAEVSSAASAGSLTVGATIGGTEATDPTLAVTTETEAYDACPRGTNQFAAGAVIGAEITTDGSWDATTSDLAVVVWVLLNIEGI